MNNCERNRYHEAGHAFMLKHYDWAVDCVYSSCNEDCTQCNGAAQPTDREAIKAYPEQDCTIATAGPVAAHIFAGGPVDIKDNDRVQAYLAAERYVKQTLHLQYECNAVEFNNAVEAFVARCKQNAHTTMSASGTRAKLSAIASRLKRGPIEGDGELQQILDSN